jgi:DNA-binding beta-propeller fold protein YncE
MQMRANIKRIDSISIASPGRRWRLAAALCSLAATALMAASAAHAADRIYFSNFYGGANDSGTIAYANLDGSGGGGVPTGDATVDGPMGLAIDAAGGRVYWTNFGAGGSGTGSTIGYANLDGSGGGGDLPTGAATVSGPHGLAIDAATRKIYWPNDTTNSISWANLDGSGGGNLFTGDATVNGPRGMAVDPAAGRIYWTNHDGNSISYANLDGSGGGGDLPTGSATVVNPEGVALDPGIGKLFFGDYTDSDPDPHKVAYVNIDGSGGADLDTGAATVVEPHGVAVDPNVGRVYWANFDANSISYANVNGGGGADLPTNGATLDRPNMPSLLESPVGAGRPVIQGGSTPGSTLHCTQGSWAPDLTASLLYRVPQSFTYQWSKDGKAVAGAISSSYTASSVSKYTCEVTARNQAGSAARIGGPYAVFKIGKPKLNRNQGTARLVVTVPSGGETLTLSGKGVVKQPAGGHARVSNAVASRHGLRKVKLLVKAKGKAKKRLNSTGKAKVKVKVTDTPKGGSPDSQTKKLMLKKAQR